MKKSLAYLCALLLCAQSLSAGDKDFFGRFHPGLEWGYTGTMMSYHHFNYLDESIGFRINDEEWVNRYNTNAFVYASLAFDLFPTIRASLISGYEGIQRGRRVFPLLARAAYHPEGLDSDGIFIFLDGGITLGQKHTNQAQLGTGYSMVLSESSSLSFLLGFRLAYDRPEVWDPIEEEYVSPCNIRRNDAWYCGIKLGVSLYF